MSIVHNDMEFKAPAIETFEETEILGDAPETATTLESGSQVYANGA